MKENLILLSLSLPASLTLLANLPPVSPCSIVDLDTMYSDYQCPLVVNTEPEFLNVYGARNRFQGMNSASLCSLAGRYDNPIPPRFLAPIALTGGYTVVDSGIGLSSRPARLQRQYMVI
jgi:hypothetical protein